MKLLIVEDEPNLLSIIRKGFSENGHSVSAALDGATAMTMLDAHDFDAVVLDIMLPDTNGLEICRQLREKRNFVPVLMLTALSSTENVITGLNAGADDYLAKPFKFSELEARVNALVRRAGHEHKPQEILAVHDLVIDGRSKTVKRPKTCRTCTSPFSVEKKRRVTMATVSGFRWPRRSSACTRATSAYNRNREKERS